MDRGLTEAEVFKVFGDNAGYLGGGCYSINFLNKTLHATDTRVLWLKFLGEFKKEKGKYYYGTER